MQFCFILKVLRIKKKNKFSQKIRNILLFEAFKLDTKKNLRTYFHINEIIKKNRIKLLISTCEGYPHEKLIFKSCFENKIISVAYQNIPLIKNQILIDKKLKHYLPKIFWSSDKFSEKKIREYYKNSLRVIYIGSTKVFQKKIINHNIKNEISCLVVPEGFTSETNEMFLLIKNFLENNNNKKIKFIFRIHPNLQDNKILHPLKIFSKKNEQFKLSSNNFVDDVKKSCFVLYRGSSAIINCIINGLIPLYFVNEEKIQISPFGINEYFKHHVNNSNDLSILLNNLTLKKNILESRIKIKTIFKNKYTSINLDELKKFRDLI